MEYESKFESKMRGDDEFSTDFQREIQGDENKNLGVQSAELPKTKRFPLRVVLTVTTGRLLTAPRGERDNGIGDLYKLLDWLTGDGIATHQIPRAIEAAQPWLFKCFPELAYPSAALDKLDGWIAADRTDDRQEAMRMWFAELKMVFPELKDEYDIAPMPAGWVSIDPMIELESMVGKERIITVNVPE